jgi:hypothetical protein
VFQGCKVLLHTIACSGLSCVRSLRIADQDEAAGAADATAWLSRELSGTADRVWVTEKGDS